MAYQFLDRIAGIEAQLDDQANAAKNELQEIDSRQAQLQQKLATLEPSKLRAQALKQRLDLICPDCFILHNAEFQLVAVSSPDHTDRFRCPGCDSEFTSEP